jgi:hypothetical protein
MKPLLATVCVLDALVAAFAYSLGDYFAAIGFVILSVLCALCLTHGEV